MASYNKRKFGKLYDKQVEKIYRFVFLKVGSKETAEDLTAQVFTKGWDRFRVGQKIQNPSAYLFRIARSEVADFYRKNSQFQVISAEAHLVIDPSPSSEQIEQGKEDIQSIHKCLSELSADHQDALILRYANHCSHKEIARVMDKTEGAVRVLTHRALKELKTKYEKLK